MNTLHHLHALPAEVIRIALEDAPDATLIVDTGGGIRFANETVTELFGRPHEKLIGESVEMLMPERFRARLARRSNFRSTSTPGCRRAAD